MSENPLQARGGGAAGQLLAPRRAQGAKGAGRTWGAGAQGGREGEDPVSQPAIRRLPGLESASDPCPRLGCWPAPRAPFPVRNQRQPRRPPHGLDFKKINQ